MDKRVIYITYAVAALCLFPEMGFSDIHGKDLLDGQLDEEVGTLVKTLFGYPIKIAGVLACSYGVLQTYFSSSPKPVMMWGGISLLTFFMPKILNALFGIA